MSCRAHTVLCRFPHGTLVEHCSAQVSPCFSGCHCHAQVWPWLLQWMRTFQETHHIVLRDVLKPLCLWARVVAGVVAGSKDHIKKVCTRPTNTVLAWVLYLPATGVLCSGFMHLTPALAATTACCFADMLHLCNADIRFTTHAVRVTCILQICSKANHYGGSLDPHAGATENLAWLAAGGCLGMQDNSCGQPGPCMMLFRLLSVCCCDSQLVSIAVCPSKQTHAGMSNLYIEPAPLSVMTAWSWHLWHCCCSFPASARHQDAGAAS